MGRAIFTDTDAIMREDVTYRQFHQSGEPQRRPLIVGKNQKAGAIDAQFGKRHSIENGSHGMFPDPKMQIAAAVGPFFKIAFLGETSFC